MKKEIAIIGGSLGAIIGLGLLISKVRAARAIPVTITSHPITTAILVDDRIEIVTPKTIMLAPGKHKFSAVSKSPDLYLIYGFRSWKINGRVISYERTARINITKPSVVTANFLTVESGVYPVIAT